jgi:AcrR family transcriptional regulator
MRAIAWSAGAALALVVAYLALGGASYAPAKVADPCATRDWREPKGLAEVGEQIVLSGLDGVACELGVSREEMVLALANSDSRERFAREHGISDERLEQLVRDGLMRAIDDAVEADALNPTIADLLRGLVRTIPVDELVDLLDRIPGLGLG